MKEKQLSRSKIMKTSFFIVSILGTIVIQSCNQDSYEVEKCPYKDISKLEEEVSGYDTSPSRAFYLEGVGLRQNGYIQKALGMYTKSICMLPKGIYKQNGKTYIYLYVGLSYYEKGLIYKDLGKNNKAIKNLEKAQAILEKDPETDPRTNRFLVSIANALDELEK